MFNRVGFENPPSLINTVEKKIRLKLLQLKAELGKLSGQWAVH